MLITARVVEEPSGTTAQQRCRRSAEAGIQLSFGMLSSTAGSSRPEVVPSIDDTGECSRCFMSGWCPELEVTSGSSSRVPCRQPARRVPSPLPAGSVASASPVVCGYRASPAPAGCGRVLDHRGSGRRRKSFTACTTGVSTCRTRSRTSRRRHAQRNQQRTAGRCAWRAVLEAAVPCGGAPRDFSTDCGDRAVMPISFTPR